MLKQVSDIETKEILRLAGESLSLSGESPSVAGDIVEMGCYEGDTSLLFAEMLKRAGSDKKLWIYDSFEGLPEKTIEDASEAGRDFRKGELFTTKKYVKQRFLRANLPVPVIKKAWFSELNPETDMPERICFAFLDGDLYESIKISLELVVPKMADGGKIVVHDYNNIELPGVTKAVEGFLTKNPKWKLSQRESLGVLTR